MRTLQIALGLTLVLPLAGDATAQSSTSNALAPQAPDVQRERALRGHRFATQVVDYVQGPGATLVDPLEALGAPLGGGLGLGSLDVVNLGTGGHLTLGFDVTVTDGHGADFTVFENALLAAGQAFSEVVFVEVSSDGLHFARFATEYTGPVGPLPAFGTLPVGSYSGFSGCLPVLSNAVTNTISPFDPVVSGGEAFDLAELVDHPSVTGGLVDLTSIRYIKLVDVVAGVDLDSTGTVVWDHGASSSADIDAIAVLQHTGNQVSGRPLVDFVRDGSGFVHLVVSDPNGLTDLADWSASIDLVEVPFATLESSFFETLSATAGELHLISTDPVQDTPWQHVLAVSVRDRSGTQSADQIFLQGS